MSGRHERPVLTLFFLSPLQSRWREKQRQTRTLFAVTTLAWFHCQLCCDPAFSCSLLSMAQISWPSLFSFCPFSFLSWWERSIRMVRETEVKQRNQSNAIKWTSMNLCDWWSNCCWCRESTWWIKSLVSCFLFLCSHELYHSNFVAWPFLLLFVFSSLFCSFGRSIMSSLLTPFLKPFFIAFRQKIANLYWNSLWLKQIRVQPFTFGPCAYGYF